MTRYVLKLVCASLVALVFASSAAGGGTPPAWFVAQALCVHSGWHWNSHRPSPSTRPEYRLAGRWWWRTDDVPDSIKGGLGEAAWDEVNGYGGGMQFLLGTWNRAADLSGGRVRRANSNSSIAARSVGEQILAAYMIVRQDGWSWREWPWTSRACGYR